MPGLDWKTFATLPGAADRNFELLCHGAVLRSHGHAGTLRSRLGQPVVEFHMKLERDAPGLGLAGEHIGWQCKWWWPSNALTSSRKTKITSALTLQPKHLPGLDRLIIWTPLPLTESGERWMFDQPTHTTVAMWHGDHLISLLDGEGQLLRSAYFGEAIVLPDSAAARYEQSRAALHDRFLPPLHVPSRAEQQVAAVLGVRTAWASFGEQRLRQRQASLDHELASRSVTPPRRLTELLTVAEQLAETSEDCDDAMRQRGYREAREVASERLQSINASELIGEDGASAALDADITANGLQTARPLANEVTDVIGELGQLVRYTAFPLVAVLADAGHGKTHLAASVAGQQDDGVPGALVVARRFRTRPVTEGNLVEVAGYGDLDIDRFLAGLDAMGERAERRVPLVIDGLNESASPEQWRDELATLRARLARFPNVVIVVTVRPSYAERVLPDDVPRADVPGFAEDVWHACEVYFAHYRLALPDPEAIPSTFADPLYLRAFCEAFGDESATTTRTLGHIPEGGVAVFEAWVARKLHNVRERLQLDAAVITKALHQIARELWACGSRSIAIEDAMRVACDDPRDTDASLAHAFVDEGLLDRDLVGDDELLSPAFDRLGGYLVARAIVDGALDEQGRLHADVEARLTGDSAHALAEDIRIALGSLLPARHNVALRLAAHDPDLVEAAVRDTPRLDVTAITPADAKAYAAVRAHGGDTSDWDVIARSWTVPDHPLNAVWADGLLLRMTTSVRDRDWTEWVRRNADTLFHRLLRRIDAWRAREVVSDLDVRWVAWVLTSTVRSLRDRATQAIYWAGRTEPEVLTPLIRRVSGIDDPYVLERVLGATYGVAMANQRPSPDWVRAAPELLAVLDELLLARDAIQPTSHWLAREYAIGISELARACHPDLTPGRRPLGRADPPLRPTRPPMPRPDPDELRDTFGMDFENYTLGSLVPGRANYDMAHPGHRELVGEVLDRVGELGWAREDFGELDRSIAQSRDSPRGERRPVERYGKKYGLIAFWEAAGRRVVSGAIDDERLMSVDLDPSFPERPAHDPVALPTWTRTRHRTDEAWLRGSIALPASYLQWKDDSGEWICLHGFQIEDDTEQNRSTFAFVWGVFTAACQWQAFADAVRRHGMGRHRVPEGGDDYFTFAGEIPWSQAFATYERTNPDDDHDRHYRAGDTLVPLEGSAHSYQWESHHSVTNDAGGTPVPSLRICESLALRGQAQSFELVDADGRLATRNFVTGGEERGSRMLMRRDLLDQYCQRTSQDFGWVFWGDRDIRVERFDDSPAWFRDAVRSGANEHLLVSDLAGLAADRPQIARNVRLR